MEANLKHKQYRHAHNHTLPAKHLKIMPFNKTLPSESLKIFENTLERLNVRVAFSVMLILGCILPLPLNTRNLFLR